MTNILPNETTYSQLTPSGRALKLWWLYYPVDTTLAKYSSKDCFPSLYFQVANEEISKAQKNNAPNTHAYFCCLFCSKCTVLANFKKKKKSKTPKPNKLFTLSALARRIFSHSHLFSFTQLETREKASNIQPLCSLGAGAVKRLEF